MLEVGRVCLGRGGNFFLCVLTGRSRLFVCLGRGGVCIVCGWVVWAIHKKALPPPYRLGLGRVVGLAAPPRDAQLLVRGPDDGLHAGWFIFLGGGGRNG